jgi:hypothetical protein
MIGILPFHLKPFALKRSALFLVLLATISSCTFETSTSHTSSISHSGTIVFNDNKTAVISISPKGFLGYSEDDEKLNVENDDHGKLYYRINNDDETNVPNNEQLKLLAKAVKLLEQSGELKQKPYVLRDTAIAK